MLLRPDQLIKASVLALGLTVSSGAMIPVFAQETVNLRPTIGQTVPTTDDNLDGIDDNEEQQDPSVISAPVQQQVFDEPIDPDLGAGRNSDQNSDGGTRDSFRDQTAQDTFNSRDNSRSGLSRDPFIQDDTANNGSTVGTNTVDGDVVPDDRGRQNLRERRADPVGLINPAGELSPLANRPAVSIEGSRRNPETDPFAPLGIRVGTFTLLPSVEVEGGYTSNAESTAGGEGDTFVQPRGRIEFLSNWSVHELRGEVGGAFQAFLGGVEENLPAANANAELRIDVSRDVTTRFGANYNLTTESPTSDNLDFPEGVVFDDRPSIQAFGGFGEIAYSGGRFNTSLRGTVTREIYGDVKASGGIAASQKDRNNNLYLARLRLGYEVSPTLQPFIEGSLGARRFDLSVDRNGNQRNALVYGVEGGLAFDFGEKLNGSFGIGYNVEEFDDPALSTLSSPVANAVVNWSPVQLTTITATLTSSLFGSIVEDENGSVTHAASLSYVRDVSPRLSFNARGFASFRDFDTADRQDTFLQAEVGAEYRFNRAVSFIGRIGYENAISSEDGASYDAFTARAGLRFQR